MDRKDENKAFKNEVLKQRELWKNLEEMDINE